MESFTEVAKRLGVKIEACGLNGDWSVSAFMLDVYSTNMTDGGYYIIDTEEVVDIDYNALEDQGINEAQLVRRFYPDYDNSDITSNPYDSESYAGDGENDEIRVIFSSTWTPEGFEALLRKFKELTAENTDDLLVDACVALDEVEKRISNLSMKTDLLEAIRLVQNVRDELDKRDTQTISSSDVGNISDILGGIK